MTTPAERLIKGAKEMVAETDDEADDPVEKLMASVSKLRSSPSYKRVIRELATKMFAEERRRRADAAYNLGHTDGLHGLLREHNPFPANTLEGEHWRSGWEAAERERRTWHRY